MSGNTEKKVHPTNFWDFCISVFEMFMNKGMLIGGVLSLSFFVMILKLSPETNDIIIYELISIFKDIKALGWPAFVITIGIWQYSNNRIRKLKNYKIEQLKQEIMKLRN